MIKKKNKTKQNKKNRHDSKRKSQVLLKGREWRGAQAASNEQISNSLPIWQPGYVINIKPSGQDSYKLKVWAVHFLKSENVGQNYDVL